MAARKTVSIRHHFETYIELDIEVPSDVTTEGLEEAIDAAIGDMTDDDLVWQISEHAKNQEYEILGERDDDE